MKLNFSHNTYKNKLFIIQYSLFIERLQGALLLLLNFFRVISMKCLQYHHKQNKKHCYYINRSIKSAVICAGFVPDPMTAVVLCQVC